MSPDLPLRERDALFVLRLALERLAGDDGDPLEVLQDLLGEYYNDLQIIMLDSRSYLAHAEFLEIEMSASGEGIQAMLEDQGTK